VGTTEGLAVYDSLFTVTNAAPTINSVSPMSGPVGSTVTITGTSFTGANLVSFYDAPTSYTVVSPTQITATVPAGTPSPGRWRVRNSAGTAVYNPKFTVTSTPPTIGDVSPMSGPVGSTVTITGTNFTGADLVSFYDYPASYTVVSPTLIRASVPSGTPSPGRWRVRTAAGTAVYNTRFTIGPDVTAPTAPTAVVASGQTATSITVSWTASTDNVGVTGYGRYRNGSLVTSGSGTTYTFTGLTCNTSYTLALDAYDAASNRSSTASVTSATGPCAADTTPPSVPQGLTVSSTTQTSATLSWNASTDNVGVVGYRMFRDNFLVTTTPNLTYTFTGLMCGTLYNLALEAYDAASNVSYRPEAVAVVSTNACSDGQAPTAPSNLSATSAQTSISLSWSASTDNIGVTGYGRYLNGTLVSNAPGTTFTFTGLTCNTGYTLAVEAYDAAGNRSARPQVSATTTACSSPPPSGGTVFLSPSGSDTAPCSQAQPCRSFNRAYRVAAPGTTVEVAGGSYGGETIAVDSSKTSASDVLFRPAAGASVNVTGEIGMSGAHIEFRDMTINQINFNPSADDVTLRNVINHGMWWQGSSNISIIGGEITCPTCNYHSHMQNGGSPLQAPTNILFDGVYFHDWMSQAGEHVECLQILGADNVTIRNSTFKNCGTGNGGLGATASLHLQAYGTGPLPKNILLENNFFYPSGNPYTIQGEDFENFDMRYNSLSGPILLYNGPSAGTGMDFVGNVLRVSPCTAQNNAAPINWRYNVIQGGTCGPTDKNANTGYIDPNNNLHLVAGAAALNAGDPTTYPGRDIDGQNRPMGSAPDAGADETG
jgi:chitodextrinase